VAAFSVPTAASIGHKASWHIWLLLSMLLSGASFLPASSPPSNGEDGFAGGVVRMALACKEEERQQAL
jgi:hypothetical protein